MATLSIGVIMHLSLALALVLTLPPAVKTLGVLVFVFGAVQAVKRWPLCAQYVTGVWAVALNAILSALGLLVVIPPAQLYDLTTLGVTFTTWLGILGGAAVIHDTVKSISGPTVLALKPGANVPIKVPAILVPINPANRAVPVEKP